MSWTIGPELVKVAAERLAEMDSRRLAENSRRLAEPAEAKSAEAKPVLDFESHVAVPAWAATKPAPTRNEEGKYAARGKWAELAGPPGTPVRLGHSM